MKKNPIYIYIFKKKATALPDQVCEEGDSKHLIYI